jgi:hypothetical protein
MKIVNKKGLSIGFFLVLLMLIAAGFLLGWLAAEMITNDKIEELDSEITDSNEALNHANSVSSRLPKSTAIEAARRRLNTLKNISGGRSEKINSNKLTVSIASIESPDFMQMEQLVSQFALFMQDNGLHVSELKQGRTANAQVQFMEIVAKGDYSSIMNAVEAGKSLDGLIISHLSITQVHDDGELALKLIYTFNKQSEK